VLHIHPRQFIQTVWKNCPNTGMGRTFRVWSKTHWQQVSTSDQLSIRRLFVQLWSELLHLLWKKTTKQDIQSSSICPLSVLEAKRVGSASLGWISVGCLYGSLHSSPLQFLVVLSFLACGCGHITFSTSVYVKSVSLWWDWGLNFTLAKQELYH
jgi:hypothetical protein